MAKQSIRQENIRSRNARNYRFIDQTILDFNNLCLYHPIILNLSSVYMDDTMESIDQFKKKVIGLRPIERIRIVEAILYSLDKPDSDV